MERLTKLELGGENKTVMCASRPEDCNDQCRYGSCSWNEKALKKLKEYEDLELTPNEIDTLKVLKMELLGKLCQQELIINRLNEQNKEYKDEIFRLRKVIEKDIYNTERDFDL